jgi:hypothetical protein
MQEVLRKWGIQLLTSPAHTPEFNGVAELFNWTMGNMVWCLLINMDLNQDMWGEAIHMAVMFYNCTPSVGGKSLWQEAQPDAIRMWTVAPNWCMF